MTKSVTYDLQVIYIYISDHCHYSYSGLDHRLGLRFIFTVTSDEPYQMFGFRSGKKKSNSIFSIFF